MQACFKSKISRFDSLLPWITVSSLSCFAQPILQERDCLHISPCKILFRFQLKVLSLSLLQVVHRDIKSGNVLLSKDYRQAKICDVGLAHIMGTTTNTGCGVQATFAYAAPEMLFNKKYGSFTASKP